jgi:hypothetical protein
MLMSAFRFALETGRPSSKFDLMKTKAVDPMTVRRFALEETVEIDFTGTPSSLGWRSRQATARHPLAAVRALQAVTTLSKRGV